MMFYTCCKLVYRTDCKYLVVTYNTIFLSATVLESAQWHKVLLAAHFYC